ncbi:hypothetical protein GQX74_002872 [Glossina fuscipes]|nr:hypothetical protein GQX74_002872 [Glossina fuscipes]
MKKFNVKLTDMISQDVHCYSVQFPPWDGVMVPCQAEISNSSRETYHEYPMSVLCRKNDILSRFLWKCQVDNLTAIRDYLCECQCYHQFIPQEGKAKRFISQFMAMKLNSMYCKK